MAKVICEDRRVIDKWNTGGAHHMRKAKRMKVRQGDFGYDVVDEFSGTRKFGKASRFGGNAKQFGEHLTPLWRFLDKKVGKHWDSVYKEICENLVPKSTLHQHILQHVNDHVEQNTFIENGKVFYRTSYRQEPRPISELIGGLWVHPTTKVLHHAPWSSYGHYNRGVAKKSKKAPSKFVRVTATLGFFWDEKSQVWMRINYLYLPKVTLEEVEAHAFGSDWFTRDGYLLNRARYSSARPINIRDYSWMCNQTYGAPIFVIKHEAANTKEIKANKLNAIYKRTV